MKKTLKRSLSILLAITIILSSAYVGLGSVDFATLFAVEANAASEDALTFSLNSAGTYYTVEDCDEAATGEVVIPSTYNGLPVTSIGSYAFSNCKSLTLVTIPEGVMSIGEGAFSNCTSLASITVPDSVTSIGRLAFSNTAYYNDSTNWSGSYLYIGKHLVSSSLDSNTYTVNIKSGTLTIAGYTFYNCTYLTSATIPAGVRSIGSYAFGNCTRLKWVKIPDSVTRIDDYAFYMCNSLITVHATDLTAWCSIDFSNYASNPVSFAEELYINGELVTDIVFPDSVTGIGDYTFYNCKSLESIEISDSVTSIGAAAFLDCTNLSAVTIPEGVTGIGEYAFSGCTYLASVTIPDSVTNLGNYAFYDCTFLKSATIGSGVASIGDSTFAECLYLESITIPESVTSIGTNAFYKCASDFTIYCYRDSYAMQYAIDNSLNYVIMDIGETEACTIDYTNNLIFATETGVEDIEALLYVPETSAITTQASLSNADCVYYGTGSTVTVVSGGVSTEYTLVISGDTNGDSVCDVIDCVDVERTSSGNAELTGAYALAADSNADDIVDINDYQAMVNKAIA